MFLLLAASGGGAFVSSSRVQHRLPALVDRVPRQMFSRTGLRQITTCCGADLPPASWLRLRGGAGPPGGGCGVLLMSIAFELTSTGMMHKAQGFSRPTPSFLAVLFYGASFYSFNLSLRALELSTAYAVWSAVVMAALSLVGMLLFNEQATLSKAVGISAIIFGTVCLSRDMSE